MITEVWAHNLEKEIRIISELVQEYPYVGMDTEFPGVIAKPVDSYPTTFDLEYNAMRCNVDLLKIIQLGITIGREDGTVPKRCTWQFNFKFDKSIEPHNRGSILMLGQSGGISFDKFLEDGIDVFEFARLMIPSGIIMNKNITWLTFHGISDFGYLLKVLTLKPLPPSKEGFFELLSVYFPSLYDIKNFTSSTISLQRLANELSILRVGREHEAGSDSFVTLKVFCELKQKVFGSKFSELNAENKIYGVSPMCDTSFFQHSSYLFPH